MDCGGCTGSTDTILKDMFGIDLKKLTPSFGGGDKGSGSGSSDDDKDDAKDSNEVETTENDKKDRE